VAASLGAVETLAASDAAVDDGFQAGRITTHPFSCADEGLRCGNITRGYGCIPPQADEGLTAGAASHYGCGI